MNNSLVKRIVTIILTIIFCITISSCQKEEERTSGVLVYEGPCGDVVVEKNEYNIDNVQIKYYYGLYDKKYVHQKTSDSDDVNMDYRYYFFFFSNNEIKSSIDYETNPNFFDEIRLIKKIPDVANEKTMYEFKTNSCNKNIFVFNTYEQIQIPKEMFTD